MIADAWDADPADTPPGAAPFPLGALPTVCREYIENAARVSGLPEAFYAAPLLSFLAAAVGRKVRLQLRRDWVERAILWTAVIAPPGAGKSPALDDARRPLDAIQRRLWDEYRRDLDQWQQLPKDERATRAEPLLRHIFTTDATPEAVVLMHQQSQGFVIIRDELAGLFLGLGKYAGGRQGAGEREFWLSAWSGAPLKVDRRTQASLFEPAPAVSLAGGIQPDKLGAIRDQDGADDGMLDRFLVVWPEARPVGWVEDDVPDGIRLRVERLFAALYGYTPPPAVVRIDARGGVPPSDAERYAIVQLSPEAKTLWAGWYDDNAHSIGESEGLARGFAAKLPRHVARLALVLHCASHPDNPTQDVSAETMAQAIELGEYFRVEHGRMLAYMHIGAASRPAGLDGRIIHHLRTHAADGQWVTRTELHAWLGNNIPAAQIAEALRRLAEQGRVEARSQATGGRPREEVRLTDSPYGRRNEETKKAPTSPPAGTGDGDFLRKFVNSFLRDDETQPVSDEPDLTRAQARRRRDTCVSCGQPLPPDRMARCYACLPPTAADGAIRGGG